MQMVEPFLVEPNTTAITRASEATYTNYLGVLATAAVDEVRPIIETTGATNLISSSTSVFAISDCTVSAGAYKVDGSTAMRKVTCDTLYAVCKARTGSQPTLSASTTYGVSFYYRASTSMSGRTTRCWVSVGGSLNWYFDINVASDGKTVTFSSVYGVTGLTQESMHSGIIRIKFKFSTGSRSGTSNIQWWTAAYAVGQAFETWGFQIEAGGGISSYIPSSIGTRAPDIVTTVAGTTELLSSNVAATDYSAWNVGTSYVIGNRVIETTTNLNIYECIVGHTGANPVTDTTGKWLLVGKINRWRMFDEYLSTATVNDDSIEVTISPSGPVDSVVLFGVVGTSVRVSVTSSTLGTIYDIVDDPRDDGMVDDWYEWFYDEQEYKPVMLFGNLPKSSGATISVQIAYPDGTTECAMCLVGSSFAVGKTLYGVGLGIQDYSIKDRDTWGNPIIVQRAFSNRADYDIVIETENVRHVMRKLTAVRTAPCVWIGHEQVPESVVYGYYKDFSIVLAYPNHSECQLEVEGLT